MRQQWMMGLVLLCLSQTSQAQSTHEDGLKGEHSLQEVVVTGTGTQHLLKDAPVQTEVITQKMLRDYGGRTLCRSTRAIWDRVCNSMVWVTRIS